MKKLTWGLIGIGLTATVVIVTAKWQGNSLRPAEAVVQAERNPAPNLDRPLNSSVASVNAPEPAEEHHPVPESAVKPAEVSNAAAPPPMAASAGPAAKPAVTATFSQPLQTLVSQQASYAQKQAAWKQLQDTHQLDQAITELTQAAKADSVVRRISRRVGPGLYPETENDRGHSRESHVGHAGRSKFRPSLER